MYTAAINIKAVFLHTLTLLVGDKKGTWPVNISIQQSPKVSRGIFGRPHLTCGKHDNLAAG